MQLERSLSNELFSPPDKTFKLAAAHFFILKFIKEHGGIFSLKEYRAYAREKFTDKKVCDRAIMWNTTTVRRMVNAGYLIDQGQEEFTVNPLVFEILGKKQVQSGFTLKPNHKKLLAKHKDGIITVSELNSEYKNKPKEERDKQYKIIKGMMHNLKENGYLTAESRGVYRLTDEALFTIQTPVEPNGRKITSNKGVSVTSFDRNILDISQNSEIMPGLLNNHPRSESIKKRIVTLQKVGLINEDKLSHEFMERVKIACDRHRSNTLPLDRYTLRQKQVLCDMRLFFNLNMEQIVHHIYDGNEKLAINDVKYLVDTEILIKDKTWNVYMLGKKGAKLTNAIFPGAVRYTSKLYSRYQEVGHDMLIYSAYKDFEARILAEGMQIRAIKNDRQLRSEDAKKDGHMTGAYPDLRILYFDPRRRYEYTHDIEIDKGYNEITIADKITGVGSKFYSGGSGGTMYSGFSWCAHSLHQAMKVASVAKRLDREHGRNTQYTRHLSIFVISDDLKLKKIKWN